MDTNGFDDAADHCAMLRGTLRQGYLCLDPGADGRLELSRPRRSEEYRKALAQPELDAFVAARPLAPALRTKPDTPAAILEKRVVATDLETDDLAERNTSCRPEVAERDAHAAVGHVDVEVRQRDERRDQHDDDRSDRQEKRVVGTREEHGDYRHAHDEHHRHQQEAHERAVKVLLLVVAAHCPFHTGLRRAMN